MNWRRDGWPRWIDREFDCKIASRENHEYRQGATEELGLTGALDPDCDTNAKVVSTSEQPVDEPHLGGRRRSEHVEAFIQSTGTLQSHEQPDELDLLNIHCGRRSPANLVFAESRQDGASIEILRSPEY